MFDVLELRMSLGCPITPLCMSLERLVREAHRFKSMEQQPKGDRMRNILQKLCAVSGRTARPLHLPYIVGVVCDVKKIGF
jgi:hypothetical protein